MWDPNETLAAAWARDDDTVSWRSLDTLRGLDMDPLVHAARPPMEAEEDSASDISEGEELVQTIDRRQGPVAKLTPLAMSQPQRSSVLRQDEPAVQAHAIARHRDEEPRLRELPSTSEMVSICEPVPVRSWQQASGDTGASERLEAVVYVTDSDRAYRYAPIPMPTARVDALQKSPGQLETRRVSMTLGDLLAKKKVVDEGAFLLPPPPPVSVLPAPPTTTPSVMDPARLHEMKQLERRCEELAEKERHLQSVLAKQLQQLETLGDQMRQQDAKCQSQQLELSTLREQLARSERQAASLQSALREKEQAQDQHTQLLVQKTNELTALETKVRALQITNESFQEQARKAVEEKEKTHKDYLQVVYDLSKLQKQVNAAAKETVNVAEKDLLLREIDQLRHEKDQLSTKLKDSESRKASLLQNNAAVEAQKLRELQNRVRELEEDLQRARGGSARATTGQSQSQQSYTPASFAPPTATPMHRPPPQQAYSGFDSYQSTAPHDYLRSSVAAAPSYNQQDLSGMPSLLGGMPSNSSGTRPMTLKDMMSDRRPPAPPSMPSSSSSTSLASMGFSSADRRSSSGGASGGAFDFEQFKADALASRGIPAMDSQHPPPDFSSLALPPNPALSAPFATEKQTLLHDSLQKRDLEQKLLRLHVEKEQIEAKLVKVEQTGLKTMSARTEKAWLESRLRELSLEVSRLKLALR